MHTPEAGRPKQKGVFVGSVESLTKEITTRNRGVEEELKRLAASTAQPETVALDELKLHEIKDRLGIDTEARSRIESHDQLRALAGRYLREIGSDLAEGRDALIAVSDHLGAPDETPLTSEEREIAERFLLGDEVYERRMTRLQSKYGPEIPDEARRSVAKDAFVALSRPGHREKDPEAAWKDTVGPMQRLQERALEGLSFSAYTPVRELATFLTEKASEDFLYKSQTGKSEKPLSELLALDKYRKHLEKFVDADPDVRAREELRVVEQISRRARTEFPYESGSGSINALQKGTANCVGYALMGKLALDELGFPTMLATGTGHAFVGFLTADRKLHFNHFQGGRSNEVTDDDLDRMTVEEVATFLMAHEKKVIPLMLSAGTPLKWWDEGEVSGLQETVYGYTDMNPALNDWVRTLKSSNMRAGDMIGTENVISADLTKRDRGSLVRAIERSSNDPRLLEHLMDAEDDLGYDASPSAVSQRWGELLRKRQSSERGKEERSIWTRLGKLFKGNT